MDATFSEPHALRQVNVPDFAFAFNGDPNPHDFSSLLQDMDGGFWAGESADPSSGITSLTSPVQARLSSRGQALIASKDGQVSNSLLSRAVVRRKPKLERRSHAKSRNGCYNCKKRRIKCPETRPACDHCTKSGLRCEYPAAPQVVHQPTQQIPLFTLQDMRFFQHFLLHCFPHHPLGNDHIWTHEVPNLSHNYEYLMHAILGLAASELMSTDPGLVEAAMNHRLQALRAIKRRLSSIAPSSSQARLYPPSPSTPSTVSRPNLTYEEGNALLATCFALTFQSVILEDGMAEFMTFVRGVVIVAISMAHSGLRFMFTNFWSEDHENVLKPYLETVVLPPEMKMWKAGAMAGLAGLRVFCRGDALRTKYWEMTTEIAERSDGEPFSAWKAISSHYAWWMMLPHADFARIVDPNDQVFMLLATHWIALKQITATVTNAERMVSSHKQHEEHDLDGGMTRWLRWLNKQIKTGYRSYNQWPIWVEEQLSIDPRFFGKR